MSAQGAAVSGLIMASWETSVDYMRMKKIEDLQQRNISKRFFEMILRKQRMIVKRS